MVRTARRQSEARVRQTVPGCAAFEAGAPEAGCECRALFKRACRTILLFIVFIRAVTDCYTSVGMRQLLVLGEEQMLAKVAAVDRILQNL